MAIETTLSSPISIATVRLTLRDLQLADLPAMHRLRSNPRVTQHIDYIASSSQAETEQWLRATILHNEQRPRCAYNLAIVHTESAETIGWIGIGEASDKTFGTHNFGYALLNEYWGRGYMSEALKALLTFATEQLQMPKIYGECAPQNVVSARVMENCGMRLVRIEPEWLYIFDKK